MCVQCVEILSNQYYNDYHKWAGLHDKTTILQKKNFTKKSPYREKKTCKKIIFAKTKTAHKDRPKNIYFMTSILYVFLSNSRERISASVLSFPGI